MPRLLQPPRLHPELRLGHVPVFRNYGLDMFRFSGITAWTCSGFPELRLGHVPAVLQGVRQGHRLQEVELNDLFLHSFLPLDKMFAEKPCFMEDEWKDVLSKKTAPFNHSTNGSDSNAFVLWHSFPWG
jgi:hypothetical protein